MYSTRLNTITKLLTLVGEKIGKNEITFPQAIPVLNQELSALSLRLPDTSIEEFESIAITYLVRIRRMH